MHKPDLSSFSFSGGVGLPPDRGPIYAELCNRYAKPTPSRLRTLLAQLGRWVETKEGFVVTWDSKASEWVFGPKPDPKAEGAVAASER